MIPARIRRLRLGLAEASVIMEEINLQRRQRRRVPRPDVQHGDACCATGRMRRSSTIFRASPAASCACSRWQSTEPTTGTDTTKLKTTAVRKGDRYVVNGQKVWISRLQHSDLMILLARTTPLAEVKRKADGHERVPDRPAH